MTTEPVQKPVCRLIGTDGNVFQIIGAVRRALKDAGQPDRAEEFTGKAMSSDCYDAVLQLLHDYVEVR